MEEIQLVVLVVQVNGITYYVDLGTEELKLLVKMSTGLSENGKLNLVKAPESVKITALNNIF